MYTLKMVKTHPLKLVKIKRNGAMQKHNLQNFINSQPSSLFSASSICCTIVRLVVRVLDAICPCDCHQPHLEWKAGNKRKGGEHPLWNEANLELCKRGQIFFSKFVDQTVAFSPELSNDCNSGWLLCDTARVFHKCGHLAQRSNEPGLV